jgi:hypothetical protein
MHDLDRVRNIGWFLHTDQNGLLAPGRSGLRHVGANLQGEKPGVPVQGAAISDLGKASHFLQQLQHFHSGSHSMRLNPVFAIDVPLAR